MKCKYWKYRMDKMCSVWPCPKNTNNNCDVIKPKPRFKKFNGWCVVRDSEIGEIDGSFESGDIPPKHFPNAYIPCHILIKESDWRRLK